MKQLLVLEHLALLGLAVYLFAGLGFAWWWLPMLLLAPDLGALGYLAGPPAGAVTYNLTHHLAVAVIAYVVGAWIASPWLQLAGVIILAHSSLDRALGYGLKYPDSFNHTHLGWIGKAAQR
jgi:hypothetical protein